MNAGEVEQENEEPSPICPDQIAQHLFNAIRGSNNLVFPNSRREVERYTFILGRLCLQSHVPNEFWPHHGSLSKEIRAETEVALKQKERPATAICTNTLELGIDIGAVKCVAQIGPPPTVASLRQRLGRSGRRKGEPAILRGYCIEYELDVRSSLKQQLRLDTVQMVAMVSLLIDSWFEPPQSHGLHLSTLIQQLLSFIAQNGGATIAQLYSLLCGKEAPFTGLSKEHFVGLVRHLGHHKLLIQDSSGTLLHGPVGEQLVNHYTFYAAFTSDEEYRVISGGKTLGTLPVSQSLMVDQRILFAGKTWRVEEVDDEQKAIYVTRTRGGVPPMFTGGTGRIHTRVRQRMRELLESRQMPVFLDPAARGFINEARRVYADQNLSRRFLIDQGHEVIVLTWLGDSANEALACLLQHRNFIATPGGPGVEIVKGMKTTADIQEALKDIARSELPDIEDMLSDVSNLQRAKWDWALPAELLKRSYASLYLEPYEALDWIRSKVFTTSENTNSLGQFSATP